MLMNYLGQQTVRIYVQKSDYLTYNPSNSGGKITIPSMPLKPPFRNSKAIKASSGAGNGDLMFHFDAGTNPNFG
jgi:hypothetical protein